MTVNVTPHVQKIIDAKNLGMSRAEIAKMLNIKPKSVSRVAPVFGRAVKHSTEAIGQIVAEYVAGDSLVVVADRHNLTKGQVAGILHRAKAFAKREKPAGKQRTAPAVKVARKRIARPKISPAPFRERAADVIPLNIPFLDRSLDQCAFLYGDDPRIMTCCGHPAYGTSSWCEAHFQLVCRPAPARNRNPRPR